ncbi:MAG: rod shape-determining protein MreD [Alphaproteobacteria bacterium]|nr:rod shape-determining protein MreD [Alphaproteobacteria bacterium]
MLPAVVGVVMVLFGALPSLIKGYDLFPHMGLLLCCFWVMHYPRVWPLWFVFILGLAQDTVTGTALGTQAFLLMVFCAAITRYARQLNLQNFRLLWVQIAMLSAIYMTALWLLMSWVMRAWLPIVPALSELFWTILFYPLIHLLLIPILRLLPPLR